MKDILLQKKLFKNKSPSFFCGKCTLKNHRKLPSSSDFFKKIIGFFFWQMHSCANLIFEFAGGGLRPRRVPPQRPAGGDGQREAAALGGREVHRARRLPAHGRQEGRGGQAGGQGEEGERVSCGKLRVFANFELEEDSQDNQRTFNSFQRTVVASYVNLFIV